MTWGQRIVNHVAVNEVEGNIFLLARAQIIDELETTVPRFLRQPDWDPKYIHFLQVYRQIAVPYSSR